jgi:uncharacterized protein YbaP (TraB family)
MFRWIRFTIAFACALAAAPAFAHFEAETTCSGDDWTDTPGLAEAKAKRPDDFLNGDGLMWRIEKPGVAPSYLFGTIHSTDAQAVAIAHSAAAFIDKAKVVATELGGPFGPMKKAELSANMFSRAIDRDEDTFAGAIPEADREKIEKFVAARGLAVELAHHLKLWFLAVVTSLPTCEINREAADMTEVDNFLAETARDKGIKVVGLETMDEQMDALASTSPAISATILEMSAKRPTSADDDYVTMLHLYRESRPADILAIFDLDSEMTADERAAQNAFTDSMLVGRNATMAERAEPLLKEGGAFIAVGALHLPGRNGLIERFRAAGYTVSKVW